MQVQNLFEDHASWGFYFLPNSLFVIPYSEFFIEFNHKVYPDRAAKPEIPKKNKGQETQEDNECDIDRQIEDENAEANEAKA